MASRFSINIQEYIFNNEAFAEFSDEQKRFLVAFFKEVADNKPKFFEIRYRRGILHTTPESMKLFVRHYKNKHQNMCPYYSTGIKLGIAKSKLGKYRNNNRLKTLVSCRGYVFINKDELIALKNASVVAVSEKKADSDDSPSQLLTAQPPQGTQPFPTTHSQALEQGYISARAFSEKHGISYTAFLRQLQNNFYPHLIINDRYFVPENTKLVNYIRISVYARNYGLSYKTVFNAASNGAFHTLKKLGRYNVVDENEPLPDILKK